MHYSYSYEIPFNTPATNKRKKVMRLCRGIVHKVEIQFPVGCAEVAFCTVNNNLHQVWPSNSNESYSSDGHTIEFTESYELLNKPYQLDLWVWNVSTQHNHTLTVRLAILPKKVLMHYILPEIINLTLKKR